MQKQVIIVGAGISGLMAAQHLKRSGIHVLVIDKGNRPGGRMATRPFEGAIFDYGAQYFTVRHERFASYQRAWETKGLVRLWEPERYIGQSGMNSIAAHLSQGLDLRCGVKVRQIYESHGQWTLETDFDETMTADALIVTSPVPQTLAMLDRPIPELNSIAYDRCLALMAILNAPHSFDVDGERVAWIADNHRKGISGLANSVTIHSGPQFSLDNWEVSAEEVAQRILGDVHATAWKLHRWKFAKPIGQFSGGRTENCFEVSSATPLILAGDAFGGPRVEGAAISGLAAAERLLERLA